MRDHGGSLGRTGNGMLNGFMLSVAGAAAVAGGFGDLRHVSRDPLHVFF